MGIQTIPSITRECLLFGLLVILAFLYAPAMASDAQDTIPIASIYSLTGPAAASNQSSVRGVRLAVNEINAAGGIMGQRLSLVEFDNASTPIGSKVAADKAKDFGVKAIIGPAFSSHALAVAKVAQANRIPMITSIATHPNVTAVGDYIFRVCINDLLQGKAMGRFARNQLKARWVVIAVNLNSDYSIGLSKAFENVFTRLGGKVLARLPYQSRQTHFRELITTTISENPDVFFVPGHFESARILAEATERGLQATLLGGDGWDNESFFQKGGKKIKQGYFTTHWHRGVENERSKQFVASYGDEEISSTSPAALAYDAVYLLADDIRRAGSTDPPAVRAALAATRDFGGVTGRLTFDRTGDPSKNVVVMEIRDGRTYYHRQMSPEQIEE